MTIKVIVELQAKPGKRAEVSDLLESPATKLGPGTPVTWAVRATRYSKTPT